jgi:hypothetical protein
MTSQKTYELVTTNKRRTKAAIMTTMSPQPLYELDLSFATKDLSKSPGAHSIVMQLPGESATNSPTTVGVCDLSLTSISIPIHIGLGDPETSPSDVIWEDLKPSNKWTTNGFELSIDLGEGLGRKIFSWKRTSASNGVASLAGKLDHLQMKMVELNSKAVVASFHHNFLYGAKRGSFSFEEYDGGREWEKIVILSGCAVLEYLRKVSGWSW